MNFTSKVTLALAAGSVLCPIAAYAGPMTGTTAAAVSIKFHDCNCGGNGYFSIVPGGTANGGGAGVKELSAAVATGETTSEANSSTKSGEYYGTTASAKGYSVPVTFSYLNTSDVSNSKNTRDYTSYDTSQYNQASQSAGSEKQSSYESANGANSTNGSASNGTKGKGTSNNITNNNGGSLASNGSGNSYTTSGGKKSTSYSTSNNSSNGNNSSTKSGNVDSSSNQSQNSQDGQNSGQTDNTLNTLNTTSNRTSYDYTGSSAGLSYIPMIK